ncbi:MAG: ABC transporter ATP-binding protein [bacterium]|jgi:ABC-2 type transport system ATP-binding protein|nr:MAG: ABC transporter ATP-binding protein [bacterium]
MLRASGLTKYFGGKRALGPVSFEIGRGETVGILGLNGVGKSTLLRIVATDLRPSAGGLEVAGIDAVREPHAVRRRIGFLPQIPPLYPEMTVAEFLRFAGRIRGMEEKALARRIPEVEELTHIGEVRGELVRNLSLGYRQRVGVAQAIVHEPELLVLDEPTQGLDPAQVVEMRALLRALKERHTVLLSSHNLSEISQTCDRLLVLDAGRVIAHGTEEELSARLLGARRIEIAVRGDGDGAADRLRAIEGVRAVTRADGDGVVVFTVEAKEDLRAEVCRALVLAGHDVVRLDESREKLETIFLELVQGRAGDVDHLPA